MKQIRTLVSDINEQLLKRGWFSDDLAEDFAKSLAKRLQIQFNEERDPRLSLSRMGPKCPRALWYSVHHPELAEPLPASAVNKYSFGHMIEAWAITLAKAAGHEVAGEQDELTVDGVPGHRDCIIDGCLVDVKSAASRSFIKFKDKTIAQADDFGYLDQLDGYLVGGLDDPLVRTKDVGYLLAIDKQLGHICLYEHRLREQSIRERIKHYKSIVGASEAPPCTCETVSDGGSGNIKLGLTASYSPYKYCCFPNLRTFLYSDGPRYLTKVVKRPMNTKGPITEVDKHGKIVYN